MEKKIALFAVTLIIAFVSNSVVLALTPMGPPKALLGQDRWDIGIEYSRQTMNLEATGNVTEIMPAYAFEGTLEYKHNIDDLKSNIIMARAGYGVNDNWDAFVRLGLVDARGDIEQTFPDYADPCEYRGFDGNFGLAWGLGTRATFWQDNEISWGGLFQITWLKPGDSSISLLSDPVFDGDAEVDIWEVQVAVGPTWRVNDTFRVYGGPFLHFVNGDLDYSGDTVVTGPTDIHIEASADIEEESQFGGYVGTHMDVDQNTSCFVEYQLTGNAWGICIGAARKF